MPKEACRLLTLTVSLFGIICMAKGLSTRKESAIKKNSYNNKDLTYKGILYGDNEQDYENEYFRKKKCAEQDESEFESNLNKKKENIIPIYDLNKQQPEVAIQNKIVDSNMKNFAENCEYDIKIVKKRKDGRDHLRPGRKNPLSYLHINHDMEFKQPEMFIINANNFNGDLVRRFTRTEKKYELPMCEINENQDNFHALRTILIRPGLEKRGLSNNNQIPITKTNLNHELLRKVRSQWKFKNHNEFGMKYKKYKSPVGYNQNNNLDKSNILNFHLAEEENCYHQINNDDNNMIIKRGTIDEEAQMPSIVACKKQQTPSKKEKNKNEISNKSMIFKNKNEIKDSVNSNETGGINNNLSSSLNNASDQTKMVQNQELSAQTRYLTNQLMTSDSKEKTEDISSAQKVKTEPFENVLPIQSNYTNNDFEHSEKNKIQMPNVIQSPSIAPLTLPSGALPNISYVYLQPLPFGNSMFLNQPKPFESSTTPPKKSEPVANIENKTNDLITISIDPKTLQNKILHAEFLKKSDVKKTPDTLSIEISPKETTNSSKHQKTVQKPLKISASIKNNSIFISGGDTKGSYTNIPNEKKNQQYQSLKENFGKPEMEKESSNKQVKSIYSPLSMNGIFDDKSLQECNLKNEMNLNDKSKTDETKVLIINTKQKQICATESPCKQLSTYCSIDLCDSESHCQLTTWNVQNFKEIHEVVYKEEKYTTYSSTKESLNQNKTISSSVNDDSTIVPTSTPTQFGVKIKRETNEMNISKIINLLKPVLVLDHKVDNEGNEDESGDSAGLIDMVNLKGTSEIAFEKGNKKVENKILEGFINSIIANYSKDEIKPLMKETTEKSEDGAEALLKLLESSMPKRNERDQELSEENKPDTWSLTPILVPESSISNYGDSSEYAKLGPFDENFIKSFLKKEYISSLYKKKK